MLWDGMVAEAGGSWSHGFRSQEAESKGPCCSALLLLFIWSETPAYETVLLALKMGCDAAINLSLKKKKKKTCPEIHFHGDSKSCHFVNQD